MFLKKCLLSIFILFCAITSFAQLPSFPNNNLNNSTAQTKFGYLGALTSNGYQMKWFADTLSLNNQMYLKHTPHLLVKVGDSVYFRNSAASKWVLLGTNDTTTIPQSIVNYITNYLDSSTVTFVTNSGIVNMNFDGYCFYIYYPDTVNTYCLSDFVDSGYLSVDSLNYVLTRRGVPAFTLPTLLKSFAAGDSCLSLRDSSNGTTYFYFNQNCGGGGGGPTVYVDSVKVRDDSLQVVYNHTGGNDTTVWRGGGGSGGGITLPQLTDSLNSRIWSFGIQDNLGLQDRSVDMQGYNLLINNSGEYYAEANDATNKSWVDIYKTYAEILTKNVTNYQQASIGNNLDGDGVIRAVMGANNFDNSIGKAIIVRPDSISILSQGINYLTFPDFSQHLWVPYSVNGNYADATGNITISAGGSGGRFTTNGYGIFVDSTASLYTVRADTTVVQSKVGAAATYQLKTVKQTHTSGTTVTVNDATTWLIVNPASILASLTVTMPTGYDGQDVLISFGGTITTGGVVTAITISPTPIEASTPDFVMAGEYIGYRWNATNSKWYRIN